MDPDEDRQRLLRLSGEDIEILWFMQSHFLGQTFGNLTQFTYPGRISLDHQTSPLIGWSRHWGWGSPQNQSRCRCSCQSGPHIRPGNCLVDFQHPIWFSKTCWIQGVLSILTCGQTLPGAVQSRTPSQALGLVQVSMHCLVGRHNSNNKHSNNNKRN